MNLSRWAGDGAEDRIDALARIAAEVRSGRDAAKAYTMMHPANRLTDSDKQADCDMGADREKAHKSRTLQRQKEIDEQSECREVRSVSGWFCVPIWLARWRFFCSRTSAALRQRPSRRCPNGKLLFEKRCTGCHSLDKNKEGPRLARCLRKKGRDRVVRLQLLG